MEASSLSTCRCLAAEVAWEGLMGMTYIDDDEEGEKEEEEMLRVRVCG